MNLSVTTNRRIVTFFKNYSKKYSQNMENKETFLHLQKKQELHNELLKYVAIKDEKEKEKEKEFKKRFNNVFKSSLHSECAICFEPMNFNTGYACNCVLAWLIQKNKYFNHYAPAILECGHVYHHNCIEKWFSYCEEQICPNCGI